MWFKNGIELNIHIHKGTSQIRDIWIRLTDYINVSILVGILLYYSFTLREIGQNVCAWSLFHITLYESTLTSIKISIKKCDIPEQIY